MGSRNTNRGPHVGDMVVLTEMPSGLLNGLPPEDQTAITEMVGTPVLLSDYDNAGRAELEFTDSRGHVHYVYVDPSLIRAVS
jgi:hypothetical protein